MITPWSRLSLQQNWLVQYWGGPPGRGVSHVSTIARFYMENGPMDMSGRGKRSIEVHSYLQSQRSRSYVGAQQVSLLNVPAGHFLTVLVRLADMAPTAINTVMRTESFGAMVCGGGTLWKCTARYRIRFARWNSMLRFDGSDAGSKRYWI